MQDAKGREAVPTRVLCLETKACSNQQTSQHVACFGKN